jgi:DNA-binding NarL/FixJ family response regulator
VSGRALRVLLADDDAAFLTALAFAMAAWAEIEIVGTAHDGAEAIALFDETAPDVAVLDLAMPRGDGFDVLGHIRQSDRSTSVLILSATNDARTLTRCLAAGATGCLRKTPGLLEYAPVAIASAGRPTAR